MIATSVSPISTTSKKKAVEEEEVIATTKPLILKNEVNTKVHYKVLCFILFRNKQFYIYVFLDCFLIVLGKSLKNDDKGDRGYWWAIQSTDAHEI